MSHRQGNGNTLIASGRLPAGLTAQNNGSITSIVPGDVVTLNGPASDPAGHAGVVAAVSGSTVTIYNQNQSATGYIGTATWNRSTGTLSAEYSGYSTQAVVHAAANTNTVSGGSGGSASPVSPDTVLMPDGSLGVFVNDGGVLYEKTWSSAGGWINQGESGMQNAPATVLMPDGSLGVLANIGGVLYEKTWSSAGGWSGWINQGSSGLAGSPDVVLMPDSSLGVFVNASGYLWEDAWSSASGWSGWINQGLDS